MVYKLIIKKAREILDKYGTPYLYDREYENTVKIPITPVKIEGAKYDRILIWFETKKEIIGSNSFDFDDENIGFDNGYEYYEEWCSLDSFRNSIKALTIMYENLFDEDLPIKLEANKFGLL